MGMGVAGPNAAPCNCTSQCRFGMTPVLLFYLLVLELAGLTCSADYFTADNMLDTHTPQMGAVESYPIPK